jgi:transcriptional regulator with XRE-family HTH domain
MPSSTGSRAHAAVVEALTAARERAALTQRELVERLPAWLGLTQSAVAKIETGRRSLSFVEAQELCQVLGITVDELDRRAVQIVEARRNIRRKK